MEVSPARRVQHRAMGSSFLVGGSQSPALGTPGPQSGGLGSQASGDGSLKPQPRPSIRS